MARARIVLVDVRPERLRVMAAFLEGSGLVEVIGETDTQFGALDEVGRGLPDVVIVEIQMPVDEGLATIAALREQFPHVRIVVCSFHQVAATRARAIENGADAYIGKPLDLRGFGDLLRLFATTSRVPVSDGLVSS